MINGHKMKTLFSPFESLYFSLLFPDGGVISSVFSASRLLIFLAFFGTEGVDSGPDHCHSLMEAGEAQRALSGSVAVCP